MRTFLHPIFNKFNILMMEDDSHDVYSQTTEHPKLRILHVMFEIFQWWDYNDD